MESMTGFAQGLIEEKKYSFSVQIKTVNSRFLDQKFFIPRDLHELEKDFRHLIQEKIKRGTIEVSIKFVQKQEEFLDSLKKKKNFVKSYQKIAQELGVKDDLSIGLMLKLQQTEQLQEKINKADKEKILKLFTSVVEKLQKSRQQEGKNLIKVLKKEIKNIKDEQRELKTWYGNHKEVLKEEWKKRCSKIKLDVDPTRWEQELALLIEKSDIAEELDRFAIHIKEFEKLLLSSDPVIGKKLDFYCQELTREANTMGSKSKNVELTRLSVNLKSYVEKLRQQVQNIQ